MVVLVTLRNDQRISFDYIPLRKFYNFFYLYSIKFNYVSSPCLCQGSLEDVPESLEDVPESLEDVPESLED